MTKIYVMQRHDQLLGVWQRENVNELKVCHMDFHCDMRGLLIDRRKGYAFPHKQMSSFIDQGNYLSHAIIEGRISTIRWVHDVPGGREFYLGFVKYENDLSVRLLPWRYAGKGSPVNIKYEEQAFQDWDGIREGEFLDFDWDIFACNSNDGNSIQSRVEMRLNEFFERDWRYVPAGVAICYSPQYSHQTRKQFEVFVERIADLFDATVERLPEPTTPEKRQYSIYKRYLPSAVHRSLYSMKDKLVRWFNRHGIF